MARARKERDLKPDVEEDDEDEGLIARDATMARLGGAVASLDAAKVAVMAALALFVNPDDDKGGKERDDLMDEALEAAGAASRGIEMAIEDFEDADHEAGEPWEDDK